ncbi:FG-GAP repeat protein, partial [Hoylesella saccharolytica F0055]
ANLQDFRKRTVSKYFTGTLADSLSVGRAELKVPRGSMEHAKILSITPLRKGELPHLPAGMVNVTADRSNPTVTAHSKDSIAGYRFLPHGEHFVHSPASITVPYDSTLIPQGYTAEDIHTYYYDELKAQWVMLRHKALDKGRELVMAETSHFTDVINGIIKVPESPETQNYVPTGISELKAADPSAGITAVSAPTANQSGTASLSYPFELPKGRAGMQPSVGLQYSSDGSSSYVGYGWSLPLQSIDIETRWGVPRFDADKESESYLLMGSKLNDRTYRTTNAPARTKDKRFYPLVEGGFAKIIRKGDNPQNYTWEVTSKDGSVSYFGGVDGMVDEGAVLKDGNGNILRWALCKTQDTHGNFVSYKYLKKGNNLYPDTYHYTGSKEGEGIHSVNFTYTATERKDITSGARMGVLQYDSLLLKKVSVLYKDELLRAYDLNFEEGEFGKTLLKSINQKDSKDHLVATQSFDYYNDIKNGMFGKGEQWTAEQDGRDVYIRQIGHKIDKCSDELTMLGGGYSKGKTYGGGLMVGFGVSIGTMNVGASYTQSKNNSVGKNVLIDIDGDGLPDKVFQSGGGLRYRKNLFGTTGKNVFGKSIAIKNIGEFSRSTSWSKSVNADVALDLVVFTPGVSYSKTWDNTETPVYFSDFNNDGLVDIAKNGTVWFNKIDADGVPNFTPSTTGTGNPIIGQNAEIDKNFIPDYKAIRDSLEKEYPLHDVVRVWCAPFKGTVSISSKIEKTTTYGDGIIYSIQKEKNVLKKDSILGEGIKQDNLTASVNAGDRIFFRLQSRYSGVSDSVGWAPQITYTQIIGNASSYLGQDFAHYDAKEDFLEGMTTGLPLQKDGRVEIKAPYKKDKTNDDVTLIIRRKDVHGENVVEKRTPPANAPATGVLTRSLDILEKDSVQLSFEIQTVGALNWKKVEWAPTIKYASDPDTVRVTPFKQMYNKPLVIKASKPLSGNLGTSTDYDPGITLVSKLKVIRKDAGEDKDTASVWMHINREDGTLLHKRHYTLSKGDTLVVDTAKITDAALLAEFSTGKLQTTFNIPNELQSVDTAVVQILRDSLVYTTDSAGVKHFDHKEKVLLDTLVASVFSGYNSLKFGHLYKGWGQFGYNGNGEYANEAIDPDVLQIKTDDYKDMADKFKNSHDPKDLDGLMETNKQRFFIMAYDVARKVYISATDSAYIGNAFQCSSRMGESEIKIDSIQYVAGEGLSAPVLKTKATGEGFAVSAGADVGVVSFGVSGSKSWQTSYTKVAAMDINGDGYPDWIDENNDHICTQYTAQTGTLSNLRLDTDVPLPKFNSDASTVGANIGGAAKGKGKGAIAVSICSKGKPAPSSTSGNTTSGDAGGGNEGGNSGGNNNSGSNSSGQNEDQNAGDGNSISSFSVSASGDFTSGTSTTRRDWLDWNGDGLPDMLIGDKVRYNLGYGFTGEIQRSTGNMESSSNSTWGAGLGTSINILGPANISFGFNGTKTTTLTEFSYADLNGDGLPDMVSRDGDKVKVSINTGTGFINDVYHGAGSPGRSLATSVSGYGNTAVKFSIHLLFLKFSLTPSIKAAASEGVSRTENALVDIDGDGYPDFVESDGVDKLIVHRNLTGRTNLLKGVTLPFGGHVSVEYKQTEPSYNTPGRRWVMASVETTGGYAENGATKMRNEFEYEGGYRDRRERDFYGFEKVITKQIDTQNGNAVYRKQVAEYGHNRHFYMHDLVTA